MKRLALLSVAVALLWPAAANAQLTMQMSNGWSFSFAGNVNAFWVFTRGNTALNKLTNSSVRTGLLPAFATFEAKGKEAGMNLGIHFGFAPQINNGAVHDNFGNGTQAGAQIDMRQVYLTLGGEWGQILAGRELGLFSRQNILNDQTLFGVGAVDRWGPECWDHAGPHRIRLHLSKLRRTVDLQHAEWTAGAVVHRRVPAQHHARDPERQRHLHHDMYVYLHQDPPLGGRVHLQPEVRPE